MKKLSRMSLSRKFLALTLLVLSVGIVSGAAILVRRNHILSHEQMRDSAQALASSAAEHCVRPLVFDDRKRAEQVLTTLAANDWMDAAVLYAKNETVFAQFRRGDTAVPSSS